MWNYSVQEPSRKRRQCSRLYKKSTWTDCKKRFHQLLMACKMKLHKVKKEGKMKSMRRSFPSPPANSSSSEGWKELFVDSIRKVSTVFTTSEEKRATLCKAFFLGNSSGWVRRLVPRCVDELLLWRVHCLVCPLSPFNRTCVVICQPAFQDWCVRLLSDFFQMFAHFWLSFYHRHLLDFWIVFWDLKPTSTDCNTAWCGKPRVTPWENRFRRRAWKVRQVAKLSFLNKTLHLPKPLFMPCVCVFSVTV